MPNYATKSYLKSAKGVDISRFAKKDNLASLKSETDNTNIDELEKVPNCLNTLKTKVDKQELVSWQQFLLIWKN